MIANGANEEFNIGDVIKHCDRSFVFQNHTLYFYDFGQIIEAHEWNTSNIANLWLQIVTKKFPTKQLEWYKDAVNV